MINTILLILVLLFAIFLCIWLWIAIREKSCSGCAQYDVYCGKCILDKCYFMGGHNDRV
jgi:hypothetical protein